LKNLKQEYVILRNVDVLMEMYLQQVNPIGVIKISINILDGVLNQHIIVENVMVVLLKLSLQSIP
jgi:hypothetical protein